MELNRVLTAVQSIVCLRCKELQSEWKVLCCHDQTCRSGLMSGQLLLEESGSRVHSHNQVRNGATADRINRLKTVFALKRQALSWKSGTRVFRVHLVSCSVSKEILIYEGESNESLWRIDFFFFSNRIQTHRCALNEMDIILKKLFNFVTNVCNKLCIHPFSDPFILRRV